MESQISQANKGDENMEIQIKRWWHVVYCLAVPNEVTEKSYHKMAFLSDL